MKFKVITPLILAGFLAACATNKEQDQQAQCSALKMQQFNTNSAGSNTKYSVLDSQTAYTNYRDMGCMNTNTEPQKKPAKKTDKK